MAPEHMSDSELRAWNGLMDTSAQLRHRLDSVLMAESGLSVSEYPVLVVLSEAGDGPLRFSELADAIGWERSRLSRQLTRMERRGLVQRGRPAGDSRGSDVRLTPEGRSTLLGATGCHTRVVRAYFADVLSGQQVQALADIMAKLAANLDATPSPVPPHRRSHQEQEVGSRRLAGSD